MNKILLVEDEPNLASQIEFCLIQEGFEVTRAGDGVEALERIEQSRPDLILSDVMMPRMDGVSFCESVRKRQEWRAIPFVFLTAKGQKEDKLQGFDAGADDYLAKPFEVEELLLVIRARLKRVAEITGESERRFSARVAESISHELRTPLTIIQGLVSILQSQPEIDVDTQRDLLRTVLDNGSVLNKLVEDLLNLKRTESGEPLPMWDVDLRDVLLSVCRNWRDACQRKGVAFGATLPANLPTVRGNRGALLLLFSNLLDNAVKFTSEGGRVEIGVTIQSDSVHITIRDTGIGLSDAAIRHAFEPFFREETAAHELPGVGLGLSNAHKLAEAHGGTLTINSKKHQGTSVTVQLPVTGTPASGVQGNTSAT
ncbi:MAG: response regulator [Planctomycetes bacterium]|nr:response regulator [Planctomycetota bacterium]MBI3846589.1 response regulator [Planctomycetota bacterium]